MFKKDVNKKAKFSPKLNNGMVFGLLPYLLLGLTAFLVAGCSEEVNDEALVEEAAVKELEEEVIRLEKTLAEQEEIINVMAKAGWSYDLLVNSQKVFEAGYIYVDEPDLDVVLRETQPPYYDQYVEEFNQGVLKNAAVRENAG